MKHHLLKASLVATIGAVAFTGCGEDDGAGGGTGAGGGKASTFTARDVQQRFRELAGVELRPFGSVAGLTTLSTESGPEGAAARRRFGNITVTVAEDAEMEETLRASESSSSKTVGNVSLRVSLSDGAEKLARAERIVASLGTPVDRVRLPPKDTPCARQGIDPDGGDTKGGTCLDTSQTVTVVPAEGPLNLPEAKVTAVRQKIGRTVTTTQYGPKRRVRARGAFVTVRVRIENTSDAPLSSPQARLIINGRRYAPDTRNSFLLAESPYPIQPGDVETATFLFDVPRTADDPRTGGALEFSAEPGRFGTPELAGSVGRIRLAPDGAADTGGSASS